LELKKYFKFFILNKFLFIKFFSFYIFFHFSYEYTLNNILPYLFSFQKFTDQEIEEFCAKNLLSENEELRKEINLENKLKTERIYANVVGAIYPGMEFWIVFHSSNNIHIGQAVFFKHRLIGFISKLYKNYAKVMPLGFKKIRFNAISESNVACLLAGNFKSLKIILKNAKKIPIGEKVFYEKYFVGVVQNQEQVIFEDFSNIKWVWCVI